jgi:hypothetical protein
MTIIRPLDGPHIFLIPFSNRFHVRKWQAHDLRKEFADLVFREAVFGGKVQDGR